MSDATKEAVRAAAKKLRATYEDDEAFKKFVRSLLQKHGATTLDNLPANQYGAVLSALEFAFMARDSTPPETSREIRQRWVWVTGAKRFVRRSDGVMWDAKQFDSNYNYLSVRAASVSNFLFSTNLIHKFDDLVFRPGAPEIDDKAYNTWRPSAVVPKPGDTSLWDAHLAWLIPNAGDRDKLLDWLAWVYQHQDRHPNFALLLVGVQFGTGKSWIAQVLEKLIGVTNTQRPKSSSLGGEFNGWAARCKLCILEELMHVGRRDVTNNLRDMITERSFEVNIKNVPAFLIENFIAMFGLSNHPDALPIEPGDRRWLVVESPVTETQKIAAVKADHFVRLFAALKNPDALAAIAYALQTRPVANDWAEGDAPMTEAKATMIELGAPSIVKWLSDNRENVPLSTRLVNIREDIIAAIPPDVMRSQSTSSAESIIAKFLKRELGGVNLKDHKVHVGRQPVRVVKLWAINGTAGEMARLAMTERAKLYVGERGEPPLPRADMPPLGTFENETPAPALAAVEIDPLTGEPVTLH